MVLFLLGNDNRRRESIVSTFWGEARRCKCAATAMLQLHENSARIKKTHFPVQIFVHDIYIFTCKIFLFSFSPPLYLAQSLSFAKITNSDKLHIYADRISQNILPLISMTDFSTNLEFSSIKIKNRSNFQIIFSNYYAMCKWNFVIHLIIHSKYYHKYV